MNPSDGNSLDVKVFYDKKIDLITITLEQDERLITVGFDIHEAQVLQMKITEAVAAAIMNKVNIVAIPTTPETRH